MLILKTKRYYRASIMAAIAYAILTVLADRDIGAGDSLWVHGFDGFMSPVSVIAVFIPIIAMMLTVYVLGPSVFSSVKYWWLLRRHKRCRELIVSVLLLASGYVVIGYFLAVFGLYVTLPNYQTFPVSSGIVAKFGLPFSVIILLIISVIISITIIVLTLLVMLVSRKIWQVLVITIAVYVVLPSVLIIPFAFLENIMPVNVYFPLINADYVGFKLLGSVLLYLVIFSGLEVGGLALIIKDKQKRGWI